MENICQTNFWYLNLLKYCIWKQFFNTPKYKFEKHRTKKRDQTYPIWLKLKSNWSNKGLSWVCIFYYFIILGIHYILRVMLHTNYFSQQYWVDKFLLVFIWIHHLHHFIIYHSQFDISILFWNYCENVVSVALLIY